MIRVLNGMDQISGKVIHSSIGPYSRNVDTDGSVNVLGQVLRGKRISIRRKLRSINI